MEIKQKKYFSIRVENDLARNEKVISQQRGPSLSLGSDRIFIIPDAIPALCAALMDKDEDGKVTPCYKEGILYLAEILDKIRAKMSKRDGAEPPKCTVSGCNKTARYDTDYCSEHQTKKPMAGVERPDDPMPHRTFYIPRLGITLNEEEVSRYLFLHMNPLNPKEKIITVKPNVSEFFVIKNGDIGHWTGEESSRCSCGGQFLHKSRFNLIECPNCQSYAVLKRGNSFECLNCSDTWIPYASPSMEYVCVRCGYKKNFPFSYSCAHKDCPWCKSIKSMTNYNPNTYDSPEFEFDYIGRLWQIFDMGGNFACNCKDIYIKPPWNEKEFLAKILPFMQARMGWRKEWTKS